MGFLQGNPSKDRLLTLHRALRRALAPDVERAIPMKVWHSITARCTQATTYQSAKNMAEELEALGLARWEKGQGTIRVRDVDTDSVVMVMDA